MRVGEAEAGVAKGAFGQGCGENSRAQVVVVVNLGGCLARVKPQDAARVLDETVFEPIGAARDRISCAWQSKPSPMWARWPGEQRRAGPHPYWVGSPPRIATKLESSPRWKKMRPRSEPSSSSTAQPRPLAGSHSSLPSQENSTPG